MVCSVFRAFAKAAYRSAPGQAAPPAAGAALAAKKRICELLAHKAVDACEPRILGKEITLALRNDSILISKLYSVLFNSAVLNTHNA